MKSLSRRKDELALAGSSALRTSFISELRLPRLAACYDLNEPLIEGLGLCMLAAWEPLGFAAVLCDGMTLIELEPEEVLA